jgi:5-formyltetrahydrofolate cyclo-ligase
MVGNRIGYGKGFYDRFLNTCRKDVIKVGLSIFEAEEKIDAESFDVPLDFCVTTKQLYAFGI